VRPDGAHLAMTFRSDLRAMPELASQAGIALKLILSTGIEKCQSRKFPNQSDEKMSAIDFSQPPTKFIITEDPALTAQIGDSVRFQQISPNFGPAMQRSADVSNWHLFEGMLLAIVFSDLEMDWILGSAVLVAPGIALCAAHVINTHMEELLQLKLGVICFGIASGGAQAWKIRVVTTVQGHHDVCFLGLRCASALPPTRTFYQASITTRLPAIGERLVIAGFRASNKSFPRGEDKTRINLGGYVTVSSGIVTEQYPQDRDTLLAPWPSIEIDCPAWGGMSGGPVFDSRGFLVGLISRSMETEDEPSPILSSLLWPILGHRFDGGWPITHEQKSLLDINGTVCLIECPEAVVCSIDESKRRVRSTYEQWT
jgi:hypothetical protein